MRSGLDRRRASWNVGAGCLIWSSVSGGADWPAVRRLFGSQVVPSGIWYGSAYERAGFKCRRGVSRPACAVLWHQGQSVQGRGPGDTTGGSGASAPCATAPRRDAATIAASGTFRLAVIGDYGSAGPNERDVAALVKGWTPDAIITTGDNNYPRGAADTIDANIGQYYHDFIGAYAGQLRLRLHRKPLLPLARQSRSVHRSRRPLTAPTSVFPVTSATTTWCSAAFTCSRSTAIPPNRTG